MNVPWRQRWLLRRIDHGLRRSDPHMAAMLAIFARLYACEAIVSSEQTGLRRMRVWRDLARLRGGAAGIAWYLAACVRRIYRQVASACAAVCLALRRNAPATPGAAPATGPAARRAGPDLSAG